jgi:hypothetical protein
MDGPNPAAAGERAATSTATAAGQSRTGKFAEVSDRPQLVTHSSAPTQVQPPGQVSPTQVAAEDPHDEILLTSARGSGTSMPLSVIRRRPSGSSQALAPVGDLANDARVAEAETTLRALFAPGPTEHGNELPGDINQRINDVAQVLAQHRVTTEDGIQLLVTRSMLHDCAIKFAEALGKKSGYLALVPNAMLLSPALLSPEEPSRRAALTGFATVATTVLTGYSASGAAEPHYAMGVESDLPDSVAKRSNPAERTLVTAIRAGLNDALRQTPSLFHKIADWARGGPIATAVTINDSIVDDAWSRLLSGAADDLAALVKPPAKAPTYQERLLLQQPEKLDAWLTKLQHEGLRSTLTPSWHGVGESLRGASQGAVKYVAHLPANMALFALGAAYISFGRLAGAGRAAEANVNQGQEVGMEHPKSAFERQALFSFGGETTLEMGLVLLPTILDHLTSGMFSKIKAGGEAVVDEIHGLGKKAATGVAAGITAGPQYIRDLLSQSRAIEGHQGEI